MANIGTAYIKIAPNMAGVSAKISKGLTGAGSEFSKQFDSEANAGVGKMSFMGGLKSAMGGFAKVATAGIGIASGAIAGLGKSAVSAFADFEQLQGGIETIFKDSAGDVMKNAQTAFARTGQSANDYMKNIASFSSSLLQSVGGDTNKATALADKAMVDMSDNASKFGSNIQDVQNAYQGFAKQNYTMLDNLKLGYGGTKSEMERLLRDAEKLPAAMGRKFDVSNYGDIVEAIHLVQDNMGIAGTTAKEATSTISGSLGMLKSSWTDLMSNLGDSSSIKQSIQNVVTSFGAVVTNIEPVISTVIAQIPNMITGLINGIAPLLNNVVPKLLPMVINSAVRLINALVQAFPVIIQSLLQAVPILVQGFITLFISILDALPQIIETITSMIPQIINSLVAILTNPDSLMKIINGGIQLLLALIKAIPIIIVELSKALPQIIENIVKTITSPQFIMMIIQAGGQILMALIDGILKMIGQIPENMGKILDTIGKTLSPENLARIGGDMIKGLWDGIKNLGKWIMDKIGGFIGGIIDGVKGFFGIHSPSRVFAEIGKYNMLGLARGIDKNAKFAQRSMSSAIEGLIQDTNALDTNFGGVFEANSNYTAKVADTTKEKSGVNITVNATVSDSVDINELGVKLGEMVNNA